MNIVVISGGSGNDALIKGLHSFYPDANVKVLVNAYDAGKSTGVCRQVTNTLGVSDIRKNHIRMYKAVNSDPNQCFVEFYDARYDFTLNREVEEICEKLDAWNLSYLKDYVIRFFEQETARNYEYKDFNVSNIVYSQMYAELGYEYTNKFFCDLLSLDDFVVLNSFDNIFIEAVTASGKVIEEEGDLVEYCNPDDIIVKLNYKLHGDSAGLNTYAIKAVLDADLIVVSTGTFWSSIFPTLEYQDFYKYINESSAKKIWAINAMPDKDCYGVGSNKLIEFVEKLGLDIDSFTILENSDADKILKQKTTRTNVVYESMGNNNGKHDGQKYARAVLKYYYGLQSLDKYSTVIVDFDDTLWARKGNEEVSRDNVRLFSELKDQGCVVSGNAYSSIEPKLRTVFGADMTKFPAQIWADANSTLYQMGKKVSVVPELLLSGNYKALINHLETVYGIKCTTNDDVNVTCVKIKPLDEFTRIILSNYLNDYMLPACGMMLCKATPTGKTTVDILSQRNNKTAILPYLNVDLPTALFIGDEVNKGNDKEIAFYCGSSIHVKDVKETNMILKILLNK